jgi:hemerythrin-like metal-binding protein
MLNWQPELHAVGVAEMDGTHEAFVQELAALTTASDAEFPRLFHALALHTRAHFENEGRLMRTCRFPAIGEHESDHQRVLGELAQIGRGVAAGRLGLARAYVAIGMPDWFHKHLITMDSALAARLKAQATG